MNWFFNNFHRKNITTNRQTTEEAMTTATSRKERKVRKGQADAMNCVPPVRKTRGLWKNAAMWFIAVCALGAMSPNEAVAIPSWAGNYGDYWESVTGGTLYAGDNVTFTIIWNNNWYRGMYSQLYIDGSYWAGQECIVKVFDGANSVWRCTVNNLSPGTHNYHFYSYDDWNNNFTSANPYGSVTIKHKAKSLDHSYFVANGTWYDGTGTGHSSFDGADLGNITSLTFGGQTRLYEYTSSDDSGARAWLGYKIDGVTQTAIELSRWKYESNDIWFQSGGSTYSGTSIDISSLAAGSHTISAWFYAKDSDDGATVYDSNDSANYTATFTIQKATPPSGGSHNWTGSAITGVASGTGYALSGTYSATDVGSYTATATLSSGYLWSDGTTANKTISWSIVAVKPTLESTPPAATSLGTTTVTLGGKVTKNGGSALTGGGIEYKADGASSWTQVPASSTPTVGQAFTVNVTGLTPGQGYTYRSYATNAKGTEYSSSTTAFTTASEIALSANSWTYAGSNPTATISGGGGTGAYSVNLDSTSPASAGSVSVSGSTLTLTPSKAGTFNITITKAAQGNYAAQSKAFTLTLSKGTQADDLDVDLSPTTYAGAAITLTGSGGTAGAYSFSVPAEWGSVSGTSLTLAKAGSVPITVTRAGNDLWASKSTTVNKSVAKGSQSISGLTDITKTVDDPAFDLSAESSAGLTVSYQSSDSSVATIAGSRVTLVGTGTTTITASQAGDALWDAADDVTATLTVRAAATVPTVTTPTVTDITTTGATLGAMVEDDGGATIDEYGIVYVYSPTDPTIANNKVIKASSAPTLSEPWTVNVTGLTANRLYYYRGYAHNSAGYGYGTTTASFRATQNAPSAAPTVTYSAHELNSMSFSLTKASGTTGAILVIGTEDPDTRPTARSSYTANTDFTSASSSTLGSAKVVAKRTATGAGTVKVTNLSPGTHYFVRAYSYQGNDEADWTLNSLAFSTSYDSADGYTIASQPTWSSPSLTATPASRTQIDLSWPEATGASGYLIIRTAGGTASSSTPTDEAQYSAAEGETVIWATGTSYNDTGLDAASTYSYRIYAYNCVSGQTTTYNYLTTSSKTKTATATTWAAVPTDAPEIEISARTETVISLGITKGSDADYTLIVAYTDDEHWTDPTDGTTYTGNSTYASAGALGSAKIVYAGSGDSVDVTLPTKGARYYFRAYAYNGDGSSMKPSYYTTVYGSANGYTLAAEPTKANTSLTAGATTRTSSQLSLSWNKPTGTGGYTLILAVAGSTAPTGVPVDGTSYTADSDFSSATGLGNGTGVVVYAGNGTSTTVTGLDPATQYTFIAYTYNLNANGDGATANYYGTASASANKYTLAAAPDTAPSDLAITARTDTKMTLSWTAGSGANTVVIVSQAATPSQAPTSGAACSGNKTFGSGTAVGNGYAVYSSTGNSVEVTDLTPGTLYYAVAYSRNGSSPASSVYTYNYSAASSVVSGYTKPNTPTLAATVDGYEMVRLKMTKGGSGTTSGMVLVSGGNGTPAVGTTVPNVGGTFAGGTVIGKTTSTGVTTQHVVSANAPYSYRLFAYVGSSTTTTWSDPASATGSTGSHMCQAADSFSITNGTAGANLNTASENEGKGWSYGWTVWDSHEGYVSVKELATEESGSYTHYGLIGTNKLCGAGGNMLSFDMGADGRQVQAFRGLATARSSGETWIMVTVRSQYGTQNVENKMFGVQLTSDASDPSSHIWASYGKLWGAGAPTSQSSFTDWLQIDTSTDSAHSYRPGGTAKAWSSYALKDYGHASDRSDDCDGKYTLLAKYTHSSGQLQVKAYYVNDSDLGTIGSGSSNSFDPDSGTEPTSFHISTNITSKPNLAGIVLLGYGYNGQLDFDEIRVAGSWAELLGGTAVVPDNIASLTATKDVKELVRVTALAPANARQIVFIEKSGGTLTELTSAEQALKSGAAGDTAENAKVIAVMDTTAGSYCTADHVVAPGSTHAYFAYAKNASEYSPTYTAATGNPVETGSYDSDEKLDTMSYTNGVEFASGVWTGGQGWGAAWVNAGGGTWTPVRPSEVSSTVNIAGTIANSTTAGNALKLSNLNTGGTSGCLERNTAGDAWGGKYNNTFYVAFRMAYSNQGNNRWAGIKLIDTTSGSKGVFIGKTTKDTDNNTQHTRVGIQAANSSGGTEYVASGATGTMKALADTGGADNVYLVAARVKWTSDGYATISAKSYALGATLDATEPSSWDANWTGAYLANVRKIQLQAGAQSPDYIGDVYFDEIRFGDSWDDLLGGVPPTQVWLDGQTTTAYRGDWVTNAVKSKPVGDRQSAQSLLTSSSTPASSAFSGGVDAAYFGKEESDTVSVWHGKHQITDVTTTPLYGFGAVSGGGTTLYSMDHSDSRYLKHTYNLSALPAPASFTAASGGATKINLSWTPATDGGRTFDEVMVVRFSASGDTSISSLKPEQGRTYTVGETFTYSTHTATVIYRGSGTSCSDTRRTANTTYYYGIYTFNNGYYSETGGSGGTVPAGRRDASAKTDAGSSGGMPTINGDGSDWEGAVPGTWNSADAADGEFVWNDKKGDLRNNSDACLAGDLDEFRVKADGEWVYFLVRLSLQAATAAGKTIDLQDAYVSVGVDTRLSADSTKMNWIGDESATELGGAYHGTAAERYASRQMAVHYVGGSENTWQVEMYAEDGARWYAPPTEGWSVAAAGATTDPCIEWRVARSDLGLTLSDGATVTTGRFTVATFANAKGWNQDTKATVDIDSGKSAAVDAMEIMPYGKNDPDANKGAWDEGLVDKQVNFWADVRFNSAGIVANQLPTEPGFSGTETGHGSPILNWTASNDNGDTGGFVTGYLFELSEDSATLNGLDGGTENGSILYRINLKGADNTSYRPQTTAEQFWWRVRARDDSGQLSAGTIRRYGVTGQKDMDGPEPNLLYVGTEVAKFLNNTDDYRTEVEAEGDAWAVVDSVYSEGTPPTFGFVLQWTDPSGVYATNRSWDSSYAGTERYNARVTAGYALDGDWTMSEGKLPGGEGAFAWNIIAEKSTGDIRPFGRVSPNWDLMLVDTTHQYPTEPTLQDEGIDWTWNATLELPTEDGGKIVTSGWTYVYDKDLPFLPTQVLWDRSLPGDAATDANAGVPCITNFVTQAFKLPTYDPDVSLYLTVSAEDDNAEGDGNRVADGWMRAEEWHDDDDPDEGNSHAHYSKDSKDSSGSCNDGPAYARNVTTNRLILIPVRDDDSAGPVASTAAWGESAAWKPSFLPLRLANPDAKSDSWATLSASALPRLDGEGQNVTYQLTDAMLNQPLSMLFNVYDQHLSSGLKFGTAEKDANKGDGTTTLGERELTNTAFRARSWNATGYPYSAVESPGAANPQEQGWYVLSGGKYVPTTDTSVQSETTYYTRTADGWWTSAENRAGFNQTSSRILSEGEGHGLGTGNGTVLAWNFGTMTVESLSSLFGLPDLFDYVGHHSEGVTNLIQLHAWDIDNDRVGDQADAEITFGTLLLTDDDATAPEIPSFTLHGTGTNLVDFGALETWVWTSAAAPVPTRMSGIGGGAVSLHSKDGSTDTTITPSWNSGEKVAYASGGMKGATRNGPSKYFAFTISGTTSDAGNTRWTVENLTFTSYVTKQGPTRYTLTVENANGRVVPEAEAAPGLQNGYYPLTPNAGTEYRTAAFAGAGLTSMTASFEMAGFNSLSEVQTRTLSLEYSTDGGTSWNTLQTWGVGDMAGRASEQAFIPVSVAIPVGSLNSARNNKVRLVVKNGSTTFGFAVKNVSIAGVTSDVGERELCTMTVDKEVDDDGNTFKDSTSEVGMSFPAVTGEGTATVTFRLYGYRATKDYAEELAAETAEAAGQTPSLSGTGNWGINNLKLHGIVSAPKKDEVTDQDMRLGAWTNRIEAIDGVPRGYDTTQSGLWITGSGSDPVPRYTLNYPAGKATGGGQAFAEDTYDIASSRASSARFYDVPNGKFDAATLAWTLSGEAAVETGTTPSGKWLLLPGNGSKSKATQTYTLSSLPAGMTGVTVQSLLRIRAKETDGENGFTATVELLNSSDGVEGSKTISETANRAWHTFTINPNPWSLSDANVAKVRVTVEQAEATGSALEVDSFETSVAAWGTEGAASGIANGTEGLKLLLKTRIVDNETEIPLSKEIGNSETAAADKLYTIRSTVSDWDRDRTDDSLPETATASFSLYDDDEVAPQWGSMFGGPMGVMLGGSLLGADARTGTGLDQTWALSDHALAEASVDSLSLLLNVYDYSGWKAKLLKFGAHGSVADRVLQNTVEGTTSVVDSGWTRTESALLENSPSATNAWTISLSDFYSKFGAELRGQTRVDVPVKAVMQDLDNDRADDSMETALEAGADSVQIGILRLGDQDTHAPKFNTLGYDKKTYRFSGILLATNLPANDATAKALLQALDNNAYVVGGDTNAYKASAGNANPVEGRTHVLWDGELAKVSSANRFVIAADLVDQMESGRGVGNTGVQRGTSLEASPKTTRLGSDIEVLNTYLTLEVPATSGGTPSHSSAAGAVKWSGAATAPQYAAGLSSSDGETKMASATRLTSWAWSSAFPRADIGALLPSANTTGYEDYRLWVWAYDADTDRSGDQMWADLAGPIVRVRDDDTVGPLAPGSAVLFKDGIALPVPATVTRDTVPWVNTLAGLSVHFVEATDGDGREGGAQAHSVAGAYDLNVSGIGGYRFASPSTTVTPSAGSALVLGADATDGKKTASLAGIAVPQGWGNYKLFAVDQDNDRDGDALAGTHASVPFGYDYTVPTSLAAENDAHRKCDREYCIASSEDDAVTDPTSEMHLTWEAFGTTMRPDVGSSSVTEGSYTYSPWASYKVYMTVYEPGSDTPSISDPQVYNRVNNFDDRTAAQRESTTGTYVWTCVMSNKTASGEATDIYDGLGDSGTTSILIKDLEPGENYIFAVVGVDKAGNESRFPAYALGDTIKFMVTQSVIRAWAPLETELNAEAFGGPGTFTALNKEGTRGTPTLYWDAKINSEKHHANRGYSLIYRDDSTFREGADVEWAQAGNSISNFYYAEPDGNAMKFERGRMRYYRATYEGREPWVSGTTPLASEEVYALHQVKLSEGRNLVTLHGLPYTNTFRGVFGTDTNYWPAGSNPSDSTRVEFFTSVENSDVYQTNETPRVAETYYLCVDKVTIDESPLVEEDRAVWYKVGGEAKHDYSDDLQAPGFFKRPFSLTIPTNAANSFFSGTKVMARRTDETSGKLEYEEVRVFDWSPILMVPTNGSGFTATVACGSYTEKKIGPIVVKTPNYKITPVAFVAPVAVHPRDLGLEPVLPTAGVKGFTYNPASPAVSDKISLMVPARKRARFVGETSALGNDDTSISLNAASDIYYDGTDWRWYKGDINADNPVVTGTPINPNDVILIKSCNGSSGSWTWTYSPTNLYHGLPDRHMGR